MYFYIDESGNSGLNLFDDDQPYLYYGILSSKFDLDYLAQEDVINIRNKLSVNELHANNLGNGELVKIIDDIENICCKYNINFDFCRLNKQDYAIISFFDQIFDQGVNPAVSWYDYWTPRRYPLLLIMSELFNKKLAKQAWETRINTNSKIAQENLISICNEILDRMHLLNDDLVSKVISDAIEWAIKNPCKIYYNIHDKDCKLQISPNIVCFQLVIFLICYRTKNLEVSDIIVDIQSEFNKAQTSITKYYQNIRKNCDNPELSLGPYMPSIDLSNIPMINMNYKSSKDSIGLQLVDIYLWIAKRFLEKKNLAPKLTKFLENKDILFNEISLQSIAQRWIK